MILIEVIYYFALMASFIPLAYSFSAPEISASVMAFQVDFWDKSWSGISSETDLWNWCTTDLVGRIFQPPFDGSTVSKSSGGTSLYFDFNPFKLRSSLRTVEATDMTLIGPVRLRQVRVNEGGCSGDSAYRAISVLCSPDFEFQNNDNRESYWTPDTPSYLQDSFIYRSEGDVGNVVQSKLTTIRYPAGGFVVELPTVVEQALVTLKDLEAANWVDSLTAAVIVETTVYHASINTFTVNRILIEFPQDGVVHTSQQVSMFQPFEISFVGADAGQMVLNVVNIIWQIAGVGSVGYALWTLRGRFFIFFWNWFDLLMLGFAFAYFGYRIKLLVLTPSDSLGFPSIPSPLLRLTRTRDTTLQLQATLVSLLFIRSFKLTMLFNSRLAKAVRISIWNTLGIVAVTLFVYIGFSFAFHLALGYKESVYSHLVSSFRARALSMLNVVWVSGTAGIGALLNLWSILAIYLILAPILVAFGMQAWVESKNDVSGCTPLKKHPFLVLFEIFVRWIRKDPSVEPLEEPSVHLSSFPKLLAERVYSRRKEVRNRTARAFGFFPAEYSEYHDYIDINELSRLLVDDPFVSKVFGSDDAKIVARQLLGEDAIDNLQLNVSRRIDVLERTNLSLNFKVDPKVEILSGKLRELLKNAQSAAESDIRTARDQIRVVKELLEQISAKVTRGGNKR
jgi:hypothetical protein